MHDRTDDTFLEVEWDPNKARHNRKKHGVGFGDAVASLLDESALTYSDTGPCDELRWITIGHDPMGRLLTVVWAKRGQRLRIISARRSTPRERWEYHEL